MEELPFSLLKLYVAYDLISEWSVSGSEVGYFQWKS